MSLAEKIKAEKAKLEKQKEERGTGGDFLKVNWMTVAKGKNYLRFVPNPVNDEKGEPILWVERTMHFGMPIKKKDGTMAKISARCPRDLGQECPMCNKYEELIKAGDKDGASNFRPTVRYFYNVINYTTKKAEVLQGGAQVHDGVIEAIDLGVEFWDVDKGLDFKLTKEVEAGKSARFGTSYKIGPAKIEVTAIPAKLREELKNTIDLQELHVEDMSAKMAEGLGVAPPTAIASTKDSAEAAYAGDKPAAEAPAAEADFRGEPVEETKTPAAESAVPTSDPDLDAELAALGL
jgi:hypothetical protein